MSSKIPEDEPPIGLTNPPQIPGPAAPDSTARPRSRVGRNALSMGTGVGLSRITGLLREQTFAYLFGASAATDAFVAAFRIPNFFRDLLAENISSAAVLPTYVGIREKEGRAASGRFARAALGLALVVSTVIAVAGILGAEPLCRLIAPGYVNDPERFGLTVTLTRWLFPFLTLISVAAFFQAVQNAEGKFFLPAISTAGLNLGFIVAGWTLSRFADPPILGMAWGALIGGGVAVIMLAPGFRAAAGGLIPRGFAREPGVRETLRLAAPLVVGVAATNVNVLVNTIIATFAGAGALAYLNYSYRLMHLPLGLVAVSLGTAVLPSLTRSFANDDADRYRVALGDALAHGLRWSLPAMAGLIVLREDVIAAVYGYGRFSADDVRHTAAALLAYSAGIPAFTLNRILSPAFYARKESNIPVRMGLVSVGTNIVLNIAAVGAGWGYVGIAAAASVAGYVQCVGLALLLNRRSQGIPFARIGRALGRSILALLAMGAGISGVSALAIPWTLVRLSAEVAVGGGLYMAVTAYFWTRKAPATG
jgi:putative peptidoglycan lipid II flippase